MNPSTWLKSEHHRQLVERWWIAIVLLWDSFKTFVVDETFSKYGVNPYIYFIIVIAIAIPYAKVTAHMLFAILERHWKKSIIFGAAAVLLHFVPDVYIFLTAKSVPRSLFDGFIVTILIFSAFAVYGIFTNVREGRKSN